MLEIDQHRNGRLVRRCQLIPSPRLVGAVRAELHKSRIDVDIGRKLLGTVAVDLQ